MKMGSQVAGGSEKGAERERESTESSDNIRAREKMIGLRMQP